jgi:hypothetical protein
MAEVAGKDGVGGQHLEVLGKVLAAAAAAFSMFNGMKFTLQQIVSARHQAKSSFDSGRANDVTGEVRAMAFEMGEDDVDRLTHILCRPPLRALLSQILGEAAESSLNIVDLFDSLFLSIFEAKSVTQAIEQVGTFTHCLCNER